MNTELIETGDWATDNQTGREYAMECIRHMRDEGDPAYLATVARRIVTRGRFGGVEVGFFTLLGIVMVE